VKHFSIVVLFSLFCYGDVVDFGIQGKQYPIIEENGIDFIKRRTQEIDKRGLELKLEEEVKKLATSRVKLPISKADTNTTVDDIYLAKWDIRDPITQEIIYAKGTRIPTTMQKGAQMELCFIDGGLNSKIVNKIITDFGTKCTYFVNNIDVFEFQKKYGVDAYPMGGQNMAYINRYKVKVLPTKITRFLDKKLVKTLDIERIAIEVMEERQ
jgi:hypothetical protein